MMKSKKTLIRILAVFLALCFFPVTAALAAHYDLAALNMGDQIFEGDRLLMGILDAMAEPESIPCN